MVRYYLQQFAHRVGFMPSVFLLEETRAGAVVKGGKAMDVKLYGLPR